MSDKLPTLEEIQEMRKVSLPPWQVKLLDMMESAAGNRDLLIESPSSREAEK